jgi:hypothetical protein
VCDVFDPLMILLSIPAAVEENKALKVVVKIYDKI